MAQNRPLNERLMKEVRKDNLKAVLTCLNLKADPTYRDPDGFSALMLAAHHGLQTTVQGLLEKVSGYDQKPHELALALAAAVQQGRVNIIPILINYAVKTGQINAISGTPLCIVAQNNYLNIVKLLLKSKANPNVTIEAHPHVTPLFVAAQNGHFEMVALLLQNRADPNLADAEGLSPLHKAIMSNHFEIVNLLVKSKASINAANNEMITPLMQAAFSGAPKIIELLLPLLQAENKYALNQQNSGGSTPLHLAAAQNHLRAVELLLKNKASLTMTDEEGETPFLRAAGSGSTEVVKWLLSEDKKALNQRNRSGFTALHLAAENSYATAKVLLENKVDPNILSSSGATPLHLAAQSGNIENVELLLDSKAAPNIIDQMGATPLMMAIANGANNIVKRLFFEMKDDAKVVNQPTKKGLRPLDLAIELEQVEAIALLIQHRADPNQMDQKEGSTPFHRALRKGDIEIIELLLKKNADASIVINGVMTPFMFAVEEENFKLMEILMNYETTPFDKTPLLDLTKKNINPLITAAEEGHIQILNYLLSQESVEYRQAIRRTTSEKVVNLLEYAEERGRKKEIQKLFLGLESITGFSALHAAVFCGQEKAVKILLASGFDPSKKIGNISLVELARAMGHQSIEEMLRKKVKNRKKQQQKKLSDKSALQKSESLNSDEKSVHTLKEVAVELKEIDIKIAPMPQPKDKKDTERRDIKNNLKKLDEYLLTFKYGKPLADDLVETLNALLKKSSELTAVQTKKVLLAQAKVRHRELVGLPELLKNAFISSQITFSLKEMNAILIHLLSLDFTEETLKADKLSTFLLDRIKNSIMQSTEEKEDNENGIRVFQKLARLGFRKKDLDEAGLTTPLFKMVAQENDILKQLPVFTSFGYLHKNLTDLKLSPLKRLNENLESFYAIDVKNMFVSLAKLGYMKQDLKQDLLPFVNQLITTFNTLSPKFLAKFLPHILWAFARLGLDREDLNKISVNNKSLTMHLSDYIKRSQNLLHTDGVAKILWSFAVMGIEKNDPIYQANVPTILANVDETIPVNEFAARQLGQAQLWYDFELDPALQANLQEVLAESKQPESSALHLALLKPLNKLLAKAGLPALVSEFSFADNVLWIDVCIPIGKNKELRHVAIEINGPEHKLGNKPVTDAFKKRLLEKYNYLVITLDYEQIGNVHDSVKIEALLSDEVIKPALQRMKKESSPVGQSSRLFVQTASPAKTESKTSSPLTSPTNSPKKDGGG